MMTKGQETKETILKTALDFASKLGLESLSIGELAKKVGMSKSGLFGHFNSKEKTKHCSFSIIKPSSCNYHITIYCAIPHSAGP